MFTPHWQACVDIVIDHYHYPKKIVGVLYGIWVNSIDGYAKLNYLNLFL